MACDVNVAEVRSRQVLAISSWAILALVVLIMATSLLGLDTAKLPARNASLVDAMGKTLGAISGLALLGAWVSGLWHAAVHRVYSTGQRATILAVLIFGNGVAAFFYYFTYVHWLPKD